MRSFNNSKSAERIIYSLIAYASNQKQDMPKNKLARLASHNRFSQHFVKILDLEGNRYYNKSQLGRVGFF